MKTFSVLIEEETYKKLKEIADTDTRSISNWVVVAIKKELKSREATQAQPNDYGGEHYV